MIGYDYPEVGDWVVVRGRSYVVIEELWNANFVCRNLDEDCMYSDELQTFEYMDFDKVVPLEQQAQLMCGSEI